MSIMEAMPGITEGQLLLLQCQARGRHVYRINKSGRLTFGIERFDGCLKPSEKLKHCKPYYYYIDDIDFRSNENVDYLADVFDAKISRSRKTIDRNGFDYILHDVKKEYISPEHVVQTVLANFPRDAKKIMIYIFNPLVEYFIFGKSLSYIPNCIFY